MEIIKSGIEVDPKAKNKVRGGSCGCACHTRYMNTASTEAPATVGDECQCFCFLSGSDVPDCDIYAEYVSDYRSAADRIL